MIEKDSLIRKFSYKELSSIIKDNRYHLKEESETDLDHPRTRRIVVKDMEWRSSTVSFMILVYFILIGTY
jgi:signal recognition particle subunit SEC65